ncbi:hypothetical protein L2E82_25828 [Cichorium intybus]|uniref:Uncharacterized protein n=1 Tax=Cichorium intybus TaxID=13427 RepID=A0ACB9E4Q9_CICIN|nr:hypothetical protein L2E82_25828 [Cichorium intybus]
MLRISSHYLSWELALTLKESIPKFQSAGVKLIAIGSGAPKKAQIFVERTSFTDDHEFGKKKFPNKKNMSDDSMTMFDRPKRKRRLIRVEYPNDTANKRFDDTPPTIDNTTVTEQKEDLDTEENTEMSKNAQFRAIQPSPSIISFVNENLLGRRREIEFKKAGYNIELSSPLDNIPFSTSPERERIEESVFRNKLTFFAAAKVSSSFPSPDLPEIAFAVRSNVGKSSLLNSLTRQWGVARTSDKPGLTQLTYLDMVLLMQKKKSKNHAIIILLWPWHWFKVKIVIYVFNVLEKGMLQKQLFWLTRA